MSNMEEVSTEQTAAIIIERKTQNTCDRRGRQLNLLLHLSSDVESWLSHVCRISVHIPLVIDGE